MKGKGKGNEAVGEHKQANITLKDALKDGVPHIEASVTVRVRMSKKNKDDIVWLVANQTSSDLDVAIIDFYPLSTVGGGPAGGGTPFAGGVVPNQLTVLSGKAKKTNPLVGDGDEDIIYKYSVAARLSGPNNQWFLVKDPELEMDL